LGVAYVVRLRKVVVGTVVRIGANIVVASFSVKHLIPRLYFSFVGGLVWLVLYAFDSNLILVFKIFKN
jgi:hypothetical protein